MSTIASWAVAIAACLALAWAASLAFDGLAGVARMASASTPDDGPAIATVACATDVRACDCEGHRRGRR